MSSAAAAIYLPVGILSEDALRVANPGRPLVRVVETAEAAPADYHRDEVSSVAKIVKAALHVGQTLVIPAPLQPLVGTLLDGGVDLIDRLLSKAPTKERWTLDDIRALNAEIQALTEPRT